MADSSFKLQPQTASMSAPARRDRASCALCQRRKIKCDKELPCSNCVRSKAECQPMLRKRLPRGRNGGRSNGDERVADRISRLESRLKEVTELLGETQGSVSSHRATSQMGCCLRHLCGPTAA